MNNAAPPIHLPDNWLLQPPADHSLIAALAQEVDLHPIVAEILYQRGQHTKEQIQDFLSPSLKNLHDPFLLKGMRLAVDTILKTIDENGRIIIHGDYDVDGVSSVSLLYSFLKELGADCDFFIPTRNQDGYGIAIRSVERFHEQGFDLLISTDCGVSNVEAIALARSLGMEVVVVDHHQVPEVLPDANAIVNPLQHDCPYPFKHLAAVGVTFLLVVAMRSTLRSRGVYDNIPEPDLRRYLDLVALGTVADIMSLTDQNRILVHHGLQVLGTRKRPGIAALMEKAYIGEGPLAAHDISFKLAPRLNAAGRIQDASICVNLLTTEDFAEAIDLTKQLETMNQQRREEELRTFDAALPIAMKQHEEGKQVIVAAGSDWHQGVLGIVASRLVDTLHKPVILLRFDEQQVARGSSRGIKGIDLVDLFRDAEAHLLTYGGHAQAAGLSLRADEMEAFHRCIEDSLRRREIDEQSAASTLEIAAELALGELSVEFVNDFQRLGPFGAGNPEPLLVSADVKVISSGIVGRNHLKMKVLGDSQTLQAFGFSLADHLSPEGNNAISMAYSPRFLYRRGSPQIELFLRGIQEQIPSL